METNELHRGRLIDHIQRVVQDVAASQAFDSAILEALNVPMGGSGDDCFRADELFVSTVGSAAPPGVLTGRHHLAFQEQDRAMVDAFYKAALAHGGKDDCARGARLRPASRSGRCRHRIAARGAARPGAVMHNGREAPLDLRGS